MAEVDRPELCVYSVISCEGVGRTLLRIGSAHPHPEGNGFDIDLQALPLNSKLVLREMDGARSQSARQDSSEEGASDSSRPSKPLALKQQVDAFERALIERCLQEAGGKISAVMECLDIPRRTLSEKMARLGIDRRHFCDHASAELANEMRVRRLPAAQGAKPRALANVRSYASARDAGSRRRHDGSSATSQTGT